MAMCEWNPKKNRPSQYIVGFGGSTDGCQNEAVLCVGANGEWHLCEECAKLCRFKRFRVRKRLRGES